MRAWSRAERARGRRIGFVPTMGFLHEGHLRLVDRARERADGVVLSMFVNPLQFGPGEDFATYPRDVERDKKLAAGRHVDCLFLPDAKAMYPADPLVRVHPGPMADGLEGAARPGHFAGVLTVVAKLFHLVEPDYLALVDEQMRPVARVDARTVVLVAARVGKTRLIDNVVLGEGVASDISVRALACASPPGPSSLRSAARTSS